tara:strand:+ start:5259 stop:5987 length:729 start_codon:yes stop_codon:yes gene_type:complete
MTIKIKNWSKFQHFKDRRPPWIKLHRDILEQRDITLISDCSFRVLVGLWLLASEDEDMQGGLPDIDDISFRLRIDKSKVTKALSELEPWLDINVISDRCQDDAPETETEVETKKEVEAYSASKAAPKRGSRIADDWTLNESNIQHAQEKGYSDAEIRSVGQEFYDYWTAATGRNATARDWNAKWRTWVSNDIKFNGTPEQRKINDRNKQGNQGVIETGIKVAAQLRDDDRGMSEFLRDFIDS